MKLLPFCLLLGTFVAINCELHSLTYIYTALSKKVSNPGIHKFTAMGLLDTKMIDYFDSDNPKKVPKQPWMEKRMGQDYWDKGTESRKSKQQWFDVNLGILKTRMNQSDDDMHVLQWMHGCQAETRPEGKLQFQRGIDMYSYDGDSFLYFDDVYSVWVAGAKEADQTKRKWDEVQVLKEYTKGYLEKECVDWLGKFMNYSKQQVIQSSPPEVYVFARNAKQKSNVILTCMATGFFPPDIAVNIKRGGRILTEDDGVWSTGIRPNEDDTYQRRDSIEILRNDLGIYTCEVSHAATDVHIRKEWDGTLPDHGDEGSFPVAGVAGGGVVVILLLVGVVVGVLLKRRNGVLSTGALQLNTPNCATNGSRSSSDGSDQNLTQKQLDGSRNPEDGSTSGISSGSSDGSNQNLDKNSNGFSVQVSFEPAENCALLDGSAAGHKQDA